MSSCIENFNSNMVEELQGFILPYFMKRANVLIKLHISMDDFLLDSVDDKLSQWLNLKSATVFFVSYSHT